MSVPLLDLQRQYGTIRGAIDEAIAGVVASQRFILGPAVDTLEAEIAALVGVRHAVACASGTDALLLSLLALGLEDGDEVIVPTFSFFATAGAVWNAGLTPVFADIDPRTFNLDADCARAAVTDRTRAIIPVHLFGQMADMEACAELASTYGLALIEDAAQAIGARQRFRGELRQAGAIGDVGCFSFFPAKNLGAFGDGGMVTTNDDALADRVRKLRTHGGHAKYYHDLVGTNSRLDALQAAVLSAKLPHLATWTNGRRRNAGWYGERLAGLRPWVTTPVTAEGSEHVYNQYTLRVHRRGELEQFLTRAGIGNAIYYPLPLHLQACFGRLGYRAGDLPESERAAGEVISLPVFPELAESELSEVAEAIELFYR